MQKCPVNELERMPISTPAQPLSPAMVAEIDGFNFSILSHCVSRQSTLIDVIDSANQNRNLGMSLETK